MSELRMMMSTCMRVCDTKCAACKYLLDVHLCSSQENYSRQGWVQLLKITSITITINFKYKVQLQLHHHNVILNYNYKLHHVDFNYSSILFS